MNLTVLFRSILTLGFVLCSFGNRASGLTLRASEPDSGAVHELTIYVLQSCLPLDWESPSSLYKSSLESYTKSLFNSKAYSVGHLFIEFSTPFLDSVVITSIRSSSGAEKRRLVLKDKIGLGLLGAVMHGRMESREELKKKIDWFSKKGKGLTFITYRINDESALRVIEFLEKFTKKTDGHRAPCEFYGGAFWSRFENEGGGCTSFGLSAMEVAGLFTDYPEWRISVRIPYKLIGGEYNNNHKVKRLDILRAHEWYNGEGEANKDYVSLTIYDPSLIYKWITRQRKNTSVTSIVKNNIPGLYIDSRNIHVPEKEPVFIPRDKPSIFISAFRKKLL